MSDKISIGGKDYTIAELRQVAWYGDCSMHVNALLDHIEAQQGERQAFVAGAESMYFDCTHKTLGKHKAQYDAVVEEAAKRYPAARPTPETYSTILDSLCSDCKMRLRGILPETDDKQARPMPTREQVLEMFGNFVYDSDRPYNEQLADAIMRLIGGQNEHNSI